MLIDLKRLKRDTDKVSQKFFEETTVSTTKKPKEKKGLTLSGKPLWIGVGAISLIMIALVVIVKQGILKQKPAFPTIKENSIAVMYFDNHTGEENLEKILVDMLTTNLSRYGELEVVSSQRLFDILNIIGKDDVETIDKHLATEIANRAQVKTMLLGGIIQIGEKIRINTQLCDVRTGSNIGSEQVEDLNWKTSFKWQTF